MVSFQEVRPLSACNSKLTKKEQSYNLTSITQMELKHCSTSRNGEQNQAESSSVRPLLFRC